MQGSVENSDNIENCSWIRPDDYKNHHVLKKGLHTHTGSSTIYKKSLPLSCVLLCYKARGEDASERLAQKSGMVPSHSGECGVACVGGLVSQSEQQVFPCLGFLWPLWHISKSLLRASSPPKLGDEPQTWCRLWDCMTRKINLSFSMHVCKLLRIFIRISLILQTNCKYTKGPLTSRVSTRGERDWRTPHDMYAIRSRTWCCYLTASMLEN